VPRRNRSWRQRVDPPTDRWSGGRRWKPEPDEFDDEPSLRYRERRDRRRPRHERDDTPVAQRIAGGTAPVWSHGLNGGGDGQAEAWLAASAPTCGACRNFSPDDLPGGRGECDHPGSGFMFPYSDTPGCPFFQRR
jgi:hypothetical protein